MASSAGGVDEGRRRKRTAHLGMDPPNKVIHLIWFLKPFVITFIKPSSHYHCINYIIYLSSYHPPSSDHNIVASFIAFQQKHHLCLVKQGIQAQAEGITPRPNPCLRKGTRGPNDVYRVMTLAQWKIFPLSLSQRMYAALYFS